RANFNFSPNLLPVIPAQWLTPNGERKTRSPNPSECFAGAGLIRSRKSARPMFFLFRIFFATAAATHFRLFSNEHRRARSRFFTPPPTWCYSTFIRTGNGNRVLTWKRLLFLIWWSAFLKKHATIFVISGTNTDAARRNPWSSFGQVS